jgi:hypothetical protein
MSQELDPPAVVDGALVRTATDGQQVWVERWADGEWTRDATTTIREVMMAPPASADTLRKFGLRS